MNDKPVTGPSKRPCYNHGMYFPDKRDCPVCTPSELRPSNPNNYPLPWRGEGQFVISADGRSVCKVNGMECEAEFIASAANAYRAAPETGAGVDVEQAFEAGWRVASEWAKRDDLLADIGSAAYHADLTKALKSISRPALKAAGCPTHGMEHFFEGMCIKCGVVPAQGKSV